MFACGYLRIIVGGFPHSEICGSKDICSSPQLIAACHVLLRLPVPRHPPCALIHLTFVKQVASSLGYYLEIVSLPFSITTSVFDLFLDIRFVKKICFSLCFIHFSRFMVGLGGLEPPASRLSGVRSNHLSYKPMIIHGYHETVHSAGWYSLERR